MAQVHSMRGLVALAAVEMNKISSTAQAQEIMEFAIMQEWDVCIYVCVKCVKLYEMHCGISPFSTMRRFATSA